MNSKITTNFRFIGMGYSNTLVLYTKHKLLDYVSPHVESPLHLEFGFTLKPATSAINVVFKLGGQFFSITSKAACFFEGIGKVVLRLRQRLLNFKIQEGLAIHPRQKTIPISHEKKNV